MTILYKIITMTIESAFVLQLIGKNLIL